MAASLADIQVLIDSLFDRLEQVESPAAINLTTHSLRLHITRKHDRGAPLAPREQALIDALGFMRDRSGWKSVMTTFVVLVLLAALAYAAARYLGML